MNLNPRIAELEKAIIRNHDQYGLRFIHNETHIQKLADRIEALERLVTSIIARDTTKAMENAIAISTCDHDWVRDGHYAYCAREDCDYVRRPQGNEREVGGGIGDLTEEEIDQEYSY